MLKPAHLVFAVSLCFGLSGIRAGDPVRVVMWDEQQPSQKESYPEFLGNYIADYLKRQPGLQVHSVNIGHPQKGLSNEVLDQCDVLISVTKRMPCIPKSFP